MDTLTEIAKAIQDALPTLKKGTPRIFGDWLYKPGDGDFGILTATVEDDHIVLKLDLWTISLWDPEDYRFDEQFCYIRRASVASGTTNYTVPGSTVDRRTDSPGNPSTIGFTGHADTAAFEILRHEDTSWLSDAPLLAERIQSLGAAVKTGLPRLYGEIPPIPLVHPGEMVGAWARFESIIIQFQGGVWLDIWAPKGVTATEEAFRVEDAAAARWSWRSNPRKLPQIPWDYYVHYGLHGDRITRFFSLPDDRGDAPPFERIPGAPAVELI